MEDLLEPCKLYFDTLERKAASEAEKFFNNLVKESKINIEENKIASKKYENELSHIDEAKQKIKKYKELEIFFIILIVIFGLVRTIFMFQQLYTSFSLLPIFIPVYIVLLGLSIFLIIYLSKSNRKKIVLLRNKKNTHLNNSKELLDQCNKIISPLLSLFDYSDPDTVFQKVTPLVQLDLIFDKEKLAYIDYLTSCGVENTNKKSSLVYIKSGAINSVPFVILKSKNHYMGSKTYHGSLVVSYPVTYRDSEGHTHTEIRHETLFASVIKPYPEYYYDEYLHYASRKGENLSFNRRPFYLQKIDNEKQYNKFIEKNMKKILKEKKNSSTFTELNNDEFEVLFHALNRDNEQEFRLLFTPLGQKAIVHLIKNSPYGDDFTYKKVKKLNSIFASHSLIGDRSCNPANYYSYSYDICKEKFISYCKDYFKSIFFEVAPILSIPIFQQYKKERFTYNKDLFPYNYSRLDHEAVANLFSEDIDKSDTQTIRKTKYITSVNSWDIFEIISHGYKAIPRVDMIPRIAGNGKTYLVPVHYNEYVANVTYNTAALCYEKEKDAQIKKKYLSKDIIDRFSPYFKKKTYNVGNNKVYFLLSGSDYNIFNNK